MKNYSIIIPTGRNWASINKNLCDIVKLCTSSDVEVILVDNNSVANSSVELKYQCELLGGDVTYVYQGSPGSTAARHKGVSVARGKYLIFVDDDVEIQDLWLQSIRKSFQDDQISLLGGPSIPKFTGAIPSWFWDFIIPTRYGGWVIIPFLTGIGSRVHAAMANRCFGVIPPKAMFGRS